MLTEKLLDVANIGAEWVLWVLVVLSVASIAVIVERIVFYARQRQQVSALQTQLAIHLGRGAYGQAAKTLEDNPSMEAQVVHAGLVQHHLGVTAVSELMMGALAAQKLRYERYLTFLATLGSNAPFIGLFGTVLGIIQAFASFDINGGPEASEGIMAAISEALIATGVGLLVAIPAVIAFNAFRARVKTALSNTDQLSRMLIAFLNAEADGLAPKMINSSQEIPPVPKQSATTLRPAALAKG